MEILRTHTTNLWFLGLIFGPWLGLIAVAAFDKIATLLKASTIWMMGPFGKWALVLFAVVCAATLICCARFKIVTHQILVHDEAKREDMVEFYTKYTGIKVDCVLENGDVIYSVTEK